MAILATRRPNPFRVGRSLLLLAALALLAAPAARGEEDDWEDSSAYQRSNPHVLAAFRGAVAGPARSTVRVRCDGKAAALGTVVGSDGWVLTKASQVDGKVTCVLPGGREVKAELVRVNEDYDLALLKVNARGLRTVRWWESRTAPVGNWVASPGPGRDPVAVGVVSVAARRLPRLVSPWDRDNSDSGYLGIALATDTDGATVDRVMPRTPASRAGLKAGDVILEISGKSVKDNLTLLDTLQKYKPGQTITLRIDRDGREKELKVKLSKRPPDRSDFQNHLGSELSRRRRGFPSILQHDTVLKPTDCGGPVVDLDGHVVGINIARAGRTESYAVPSEAVLPLLSRLSGGRIHPALVRQGDESRSDKVTSARRP